nr:hypothetical protein [Pelomicrobium methylotrophicum]
MSSVDVRMCLVAARRATEDVPLADAWQPAPGASPAGIGRIDFRHRDPKKLCFVLDGAVKFASLPQRKASAKCFAAHSALFGLRNSTQVFEDENCVGRCPLHEGCRSLLGESAGAVTLLAAKPFERTANAFCVLALCLSGRKLALETRASLLGSAVGHFDSFTGDEQGVAVGIGGHQRVGFVHIDANRQDASGLRYFQRNGDTSKQLAIALDDGQAIDLLGLRQGCTECVRDSVGKALSAAHRPNGQGAVGAKKSASRPRLPTRKIARARRKAKGLEIRCRLRFALW